MKQTSVCASLTWLLSRSFSIYSARNPSTRFSRKPGSEMSVCSSVCHSQVDCWRGSTPKQPDSPPRIIGLSFEKGVELADRLKPLVPEDLTLGDMALRWCLDFDAVSAIIPGARNPEQARSNARSSTLPPLPEALHQDLADFYAREVAPHIRGAY